MGFLCWTCFDCEMWMLIRWKILITESTIRKREKKRCFFFFFEFYFQLTQLDCFRRQHEFVFQTNSFSKCILHNFKYLMIYPSYRFADKFTVFRDNERSHHPAVHRALGKSNSIFSFVCSPFFPSRNFSSCLCTV